MQARPFRLATLLCLLTLAGCALGPRAPSPDELAKAQALAAQGDNLAAAELYEQLGERAASPAREDMLLKAAEQYRRAAFPERASALLATLDSYRLTPSQQVDYAVVMAELDLINQKPRQALDRVSFLLDGLPATTRSAVLSVRARALFAMGAAVDASRLLIRRAALLPTATARLDNQRMIWLGLRQSRETLNPSSLSRDSEPVLRGWLELAVLHTQTWGDASAFARQLAVWRRTWPQHPANGALAEEILADVQRLATYPAKVALLLSLSGRYALQAQATRDGFLAALYRLGATAPAIQIYDTAGSPAVVAQRYQQAVAAGANYVVGPLTKEGAAALAGMSELPVPVLALNYLDDNGTTTPPPQLFQFGLAPEDEARQAAERIIQEGMTRGVGLAPADDWGNRLMLAFKARFEELGGTLLEGQYYAPAQNDFSTPITRVLDLDESQQRFQALRGMLGLDLHFEPRRRQDVQFVFLAARERDARLLRPQLKFYHALDLPVFTTSHVYVADGRPDRDLNGIKFADMPWMIAPNAVGAATRDQIQELWGGRFAQAGRLYALGFDAFRLIPVLANTVNPLASPLPGVTGLLSMDAQHRIHRGLYWATFTNGKPVLLPPPEEILPPVTAQADARPAG